MQAESFPALSELLPHTGPALLLDEVVSHTPESSTCLVEIRDSMQYVTEGRADAVLALELMAQAAAAHVRLEELGRHVSPRVGYLVGVPNMSFWGGDYLVGQSLLVTVQVVFHEGALARFSGQVTHKDTLRAEGSFTVFEPPAGPPS